MTKYKFTKLLKEKIHVSAFEYLTEKQGIKGQEIRYTCMEMSEYLLPTTKKLSISEKRKMFAIRNKMIDIPSNFSSSSEKIECLCGEIENMEHVYKCEKEVELPYEKV